MPGVVVLSALRGRCVTSGSGEVSHNTELIVILVKRSFSSILPGQGLQGA